MDYNTSREHLVMPEYGRNIQEMVDFALTIPDRYERTRCVATIANVIYNLFPQIKEDDNYQAKVWSHLDMISGYRLDVDSPYPLPGRPEAAAKSAYHVPYPHNSIRLRLYGSIVQQMLTKAVATDDEDDRMLMVAQTAAYMKAVILQNGKDNNAEDKVIADIAELSGGRLHYDYQALMRFKAAEEKRRAQEEAYEAAAATDYAPDYGKAPNAKQAQQRQPNQNNQGAQRYNNGQQNNRGPVQQNNNRGQQNYGQQNYGNNGGQNYGQQNYGNNNGGNNNNGRKQFNKRRN